MQTRSSQLKAQLIQLQKESLKKRSRFGSRQAVVFFHVFLSQLHKLHASLTTMIFFAFFLHSAVPSYGIYIFIIRKYITNHFNYQLTVGLIASSIS